MARIKRLLTYDSIYNGVIGEKISQNCSDVILHELFTSGIRVIIDLRHDYTSDRFARRCASYGIRYFMYPIHLDDKSVGYIAEHFREFCELIQSERFYMMGQHRAYTALCVYWALSKTSDLYPMELVLSIKRNKRLMNKTISLLHAIVDYEERNNSGKDDIDTVFIAESKASIERFVTSDGPESINFSFVSFDLSHRNGTMTYDISVADMGVLGYLYRASDEFGGWNFDIIKPRPRSGKSYSFAEAQKLIANYLSEDIPLDPLFTTFSNSLKQSIILFRKQLS